MKKVIAVVVVLVLVVLVTPIFAAEGGKKGASAEAYEHASEQAIFHRVSDWFATIGKSPEEKAEILEERSAKRAEKYAEKEAKKAEKQAGKAVGKSGKQPKGLGK